MLASSSIAVATSERHTAFETRSATHTAIFKYTAKAPTECASNYSFKPRPLRGLAHALSCNTPLGRCASRLNSGVRRGKQFNATQTKRRRIAWIYNFIDQRRACERTRQFLARELASSALEPTWLLRIALGGLCTKDDSWSFGKQLPAAVSSRND